MLYKFNSFKNNLLIAMTKLDGSYFSESVVLICEHDTNGAMGLVINKPLDVSIANILLQMKIKHNITELAHTPTFAGGPLKSEKGFVLHYIDEPDEQNVSYKAKEWKNSISIDDNLAITTSNDIMHAIASGLCPQPYIIALGYCKWEAGQLEDEIKNNCWLNTPLDLDIIFNVPCNNRWRECTYNLGIDDSSNLSYYCGHA